MLSAQNEAPEWAGFGGLNGGLSGDVRTFVDAGAGGIYLGGAFDEAGGEAGIHGIVHWDGRHWTALGEGIEGGVNAAVMQGGALVVAGDFISAGGVEVANVARWQGGVWQPLGSGLNGVVHALAVHQGQIYVGGEFTEAGGQPASGIARWDGSQWQPVGDGVSGGAVFALHSTAAGLLVGGSFTSAGAVPAARVALWTGSVWQTLGLGLNGTVWSIKSQGTDWYVGGDFTQAGGLPSNRVAQWNGSAWSALGEGVNARVSALEVDEGGVWAGGGFTQSGEVTVTRIARWDGLAWKTAASGVNREVYALGKVGGKLYAGGRFTQSGSTQVNRVAVWEAGNWRPLGTGLSSWATAVVVAPNGNEVMAAGNFTQAGGDPAQGVARWDGNRWQPLGEGLNGLVRALIYVGNDLYAGGEFTQSGAEPVAYLARWNGTAWVSVGTGVSGPVRALATDGASLYVGGQFTQAGGQPAARVACWTGSAWQNLGSGVDSTVEALTFADGKLYAGGSFLQAGGQAANHIAVWNGLTWSALGSGVNAAVYALAAREGKLYAGGLFTEAGGSPALNVAHWTGTHWSALGAGVNGDVYALHWAGDGKLFVGGGFDAAGGQAVNRLAVWANDVWSPLGTGADGEVLALSPAGGDLLVGGAFLQLGDRATAFAGSAVDVIEPYVQISPMAQALNQQGDEYEVRVNSNTDWQVVVPDAWVQVEPSSGQEDAVLTVAVSANPTNQSRISLVQIGDQTHQITQSAIPPSYEVQPPARTVTSAGETYEVSVVSDGAWTVENLASWVAVTPDQGDGNGTLTVTVEPRTEIGSRTVTLGIGSASHAITQTGVPPVLEVSPLQQLVPSAGGNHWIDITANQPWQLSEQADWLSVDVDHGTTNAQVTVTVQPNLSVTERVTKINIGGVSHEVRQAGVPFVSQLQVGQPFTFVFAGVSQVLKVSGLPAGLTFNVRTGTISGRPTRSAQARVTLQVRDLDGQKQTRVFNLEVSPLPPWGQGAFVAVQQRQDAVNQGLGGLVNGLVTASGAASGRVTVAGKVYPFRGLAYSDGADAIEVRAEVRSGKLSPFTLVLTPKEDETVTGELGLEGESTPFLKGWRQVWHAKKRPVPPAQVGAYNLFVDLKDEFFNLSSIPQGVGFLRSQVASSGIMRWTGKTGDGSVLTFTGHLGPALEWLIWRSLYSNTGSVSLAGELLVDGRVMGTGDWIKTYQVSEKVRHYREGFYEQSEAEWIPVTLDVAGSKWVSLTGGGSLPGLLGVAVPNNVYLEFQAGGIGFTTGPWPGLEFTLDSLYRVSLPKPGSLENPARTRFNLDRTTGLLSGDFRLIDDDLEKPGKELLRAVPFQGLLVNGFGTLLGAGHFRLNQLAEPPTTRATTSPQLSGAVFFKAKNP